MKGISKMTMMTRLIAGAALALAPALPVLAPAAIAAPVASDDPVSQMFVWWNEAFKTPGAFTPENFRKHFTEDATLVLEGKTVINGVEGWAKHFQKIQAGGGDVEIVVPFKDMFRVGDRVYTYHVIRSRRDGKTACSLAAGHGVIRDGKIASIVLVRSELDPAKGQTDPQCWTR